MSLKCGIVGLPNVGKSSLFNALSGKSGLAESMNYPFCTIEPNVQQVPVNDTRLHILSNISKSEKIVPVMLDVVDIAGIIKGAHEGEGMGNAFLSHIREVDVIIHLIRCFDRPEIHHVDGSVDPIRDINTIDSELMFADLQSIEKRLKKEKQNKDFFKSLEDHIVSGGFISTFEAKNAEEEKMIKEMNFITNKKVLYVCNVDDYESENQFYKSASKYIKEEKGSENVLKISTKLEEEVNTLTKTEREEFLADLNIQRSCFDLMMNALYKMLRRITFFTSGKKETRAWSIPSVNAKESAKCIHGDISDGFINAEVINYKDFLQVVKNEGGFAESDNISEKNYYQAAKEKGLVKIKGADYLVQDGDIIVFNHR